MEELNATEAKREFGELLIKVQTEPISISRNGKPIAVIVSDKEFHELESFKEQVLKLAISEGLDDLAKNKIHSHKVVFDNLKIKLNGSV
ncbi:MULTISPECIES: type II toxin-antitoxin system Phd/YefM family antitoxin [unclassified Candidatus Tisiphia]|jgi:prevent-host-death family protein|uniref:type II toxin-antitoxin system Phd/YefM family antitoxin n=1 Tax=unclassified Candidatus Tisiphia TaxID=2996318 RepID=UPI001E77700E|nr:MAG: type II toxin-antitoxin system prevent-host-death family antitoxin [Rickettsia endosymbiont of Cimex lectularius]